MSTPQKLRLMTYLSPGVPIQVFELLLHYLEEVTGLEGYLITESRWSGPPADRRDPFTDDVADIAFMCSSAYLRLKHDNIKHVELCPAAPVHRHPMGGGAPVYFSDLVVNSSRNLSFTSFVDLKGLTFAYNDPVSLSGSLVVLGNLKKMGYDSSFFGNMLHSGSHLKSIKMILDNKADVAAIDSNVLKFYLEQNPADQDNLSVVTSLGPMPIYPVVFNSRLSDNLKKQISEALLGMHKLPAWSEKLEEWNIQQFTQVDESLYDLETNLMDVVKGLSLNSVYY
ncbi:putative ABC transporter phosphonate/phosphite binding protein PhnD2 [Crassostrea virginica]